jgi:hypothetical protein
MKVRHATLLDRLLIATAAVAAWLAVVVWAGHGIGASQIEIVAAVWAGIGAIVTGAALSRRR